VVNVGNDGYISDLHNLWSPTDWARFSSCKSTPKSPNFLAEQLPMGRNNTKNMQLLADGSNFPAIPFTY
jgi:hypothetical protein